MTTGRTGPVGFLALALALSTAPSAGQESDARPPGPPPGVLVGQVTGEALDDPLEGALVYIKGQDFATVTDSMGIYAMAVPPGAWIVSVYHPRAAEMGLPRPPTSFLTLSSGGRLRVDFTLDPAVLGSQQSPYVMEALEVMVEGFTRRPELEVGANMEVLDPDVLAARLPGARHVGDLIQGQFSGLRVHHTRGIDLCVETARGGTVRRAGGGGSGTCPGRVAVVLDGIMLVDPGPTLRGMSPDAVARVEYLPATWATTEWGSRAGNGVLYIWTRSRR